MELKMLNAMKIIWAEIPKKWIALIFSLCLGIFFQHFFDVYFNNAKLLSWPKFIPILVISLILLIIYFIVCFMIISIRIISKRTENKKVLPDKYVPLGSFETSDKIIGVDIQAKIVLGDKLNPGIQNFLNRIALGEPYCNLCHRPLDKLRASWMADGVQVGYKCDICNVQKDYKWTDLRNDVFATIRSDYDNFWEVYKERIENMTDGKPEKYILP